MTRLLARSSVGCQACFAMPRQIAGMLTARPTLRIVRAYLSPRPTSPIRHEAGMRTSFSVMCAFSMPRHSLELTALPNQHSRVFISRTKAV